MKKGQVTIWVIIGILLLAATTLIFIWQSPSLKTQSEDFTAIESSIHSCVHSSAEKAIILVGKQGGIYDVENGVEFANHMVPIYYNKGTSTTPNKLTLEKELAMAIKKPLDNCLFEIQDPQFTPILQEVSSNIKKNSVTVEAKISLELQEVIDKESIENTIIDLYREDLFIDYNKLPKIAEEIVDAQEIEKLPVSKIMDIAEKNNVQFEFITVENTLLISLVDNELFDKPYYFTFGLQHVDKLFEEDFLLQNKLTALIQQ